MRNERGTYKRVKINWWIIILLGGITVWMIFAYIHQWGNRPIGRKDLLILVVIFLTVLLFLGRFRVVIDDNFAVFRSDIWVPIKVPIARIVNVSIKQVALMEVNIPGKNIVKYQFDFFVKQAVSIRLQSGKTYQIAIRDAQKIKEEIEKRMLMPNNKHDEHGE